MSRKLWIVLPIAFLSHFVLDYIPHVESSFAYLGRPHWVMVLVGAISNGLAVVLLFWACYRKPNWRIMCMGALVAILPNLIDRTFGSERVSTWPGTAWFYSIHHTFHHSLAKAQWRLGLATQAVVIVVALWAARRGNG